jgi:hypothetical protein
METLSIITSVVPPYKDVHEYMGKNNALVQLNTTNIAHNID